MAARPRDRRLPETCPVDLGPPPAGYQGWEARSDVAEALRRDGTVYLVIADGAPLGWVVGEETGRDRRTGHPIFRWRADELKRWHGDRRGAALDLVRSLASGER